MASDIGSVHNFGGEKTVITSTGIRSYTARVDYHGNSRKTDSSGVTEFTPNIYRQTAIMDRFITVGGDDSKFVKGNKETRVDNGDYTIFIGPAEALHTDAYSKWAEEFATIAAANLLPETKIPAFPILQGISYDDL